MDEQFDSSRLDCWMRAIIAASERDPDEARTVIRGCLAEYRNSGDRDRVSSMLQLLGDVEMNSGNRVAFEQHYAESVAVSPRPHGALLFYAEALLFRAGDRQAALEALTDLESILADRRNVAAAADMPGTFYEDAIAALRAEACSDGDPDPMALGKVLLALPRPDDR